MALFHRVCVLAFLLMLHKCQALFVMDESDPSMPFQLTVTPEIATRYTGDTMTMRCEQNPNVATNLAQVFILRIAKQSASGWDMVAEQRDNEPSPTASGNMTVSASVGGLSTSQVFLEVSWDTIGPDCFGVFKCYAMGFDAAEEALTEKSSTLQVYEFKNFINRLMSIAVDTQEKVQVLNNFTDAEIARLEQGFQQLVDSVTANQTAVVGSLQTIEERLNNGEISTDAKISQLEQELLDKDIEMAAYRANQSSLETRVADLESRLSSMNQWPAGHYALLRPKTGCPLDQAFYGRNRAYMKLHTQSQPSSDPADAHSSAFARNTKSRRGSKKFVRLEFCEVSRQFSLFSWPQGSFCVNKLDGRYCPTGFSDGYVHFDTEDSGDASEARNNVGGKHNLYFCCQNTTSTSVPVQLPTHTPFFLYRYGGVCQNVKGMSFSEEFVQINTEDSSNADRLYDSLPDIDQPGSSVIKLNLCYYTKL